VNELSDDLEDYSDLSSEARINIKEPIFPVSLDSLGMSWRDFF